MIRPATLMPIPAKEGLAFEELGGVKPNPRLALAEEGVKKAVEMQADFILAVGGGSSIDTAKAVAHGAANPEEALWDIWTKKVPLTKSLPVGAVLTIPAAGSEMSDSAVLTNEAIGKKAGINTPFNRCKFAIMNPDFFEKEFMIMAEEKAINLQFCPEVEELMVWGDKERLGTVVRNLQIGRASCRERV